MDNDTADDAVTPRPAKRACHPLTATASSTDGMVGFPPPPLAAATASSSASSGYLHSVSNSSAASAGGGGRKRKSTADTTGSRSPSKRLTDRQHHTRLPVTQGYIVGLADVPDSMKALYRALHRLRRGVSVLHARHRDWLPRLQGCFDEAEDERMFDGDDVDHNQRDRVGTAPSIEWAERILAHALSNYSLGASEAAWNCSVHSPLLDEALRHSPHVKALTATNVTTARIHPPSLLDAAPPAASASAQASSKRVDFCVALQLDDALHGGVPRAMIQHNIHSLNHTDYNPVRHRPIAISIETKASRADDPEAVLQLTTWGSAQLTMLLQLRSVIPAATTPAAVPPLPMILVGGHSWRLYLLCLDEKPGLSKASLLRGLEIGDTSSLLGIFTLIASLQHLYDWAHNSYRPWFNEHILASLDDQASSAPS